MTLLPHLLALPVQTASFESTQALCRTIKAEPMPRLTLLGKRSVATVLGNLKRAGPASNGWSDTWRLLHTSSNIQGVLLDRPYSYSVYLDTC